MIDGCIELLSSKAQPESDGLQILQVAAHVLTQNTELWHPSMGITINIFIINYSELDVQVFDVVVVGGKALHPW